MSCIFGQKICISQQNIIDNQYTTYKNKVYDISKYQHPGGQPLLFKAKGKTLEEFFYKSQYSFHVNSVQTIADLNSIYVGDICSENTVNNKDILDFIWTINDNKIFITTTTKTIFNDQWFSVAFPIKDKQMAYSDAIIGWKYNNTLNIEAFMLAPQLKINPYLIFNYKKNPDFLLSKSISVNNDNFTISFTKLIDNKQTYNILYTIGNKFSKDKIDKHVIYNNFYIDKNVKQNSKEEVVEIDLNIVNFYFLIATVSLYFLFFLVIFIVTNSYYITYFLYILDLQYLGYYTYGSIIFMTIYSLWWVSILMYSFYGINNNDILYRLGVWICLNISTTLLPITRNSIWVVFSNYHMKKLYLFIYTWVYYVQ